jgi:hypothetical protein
VKKQKNWLHRICSFKFNLYRYGEALNKPGAAGKAVVFSQLRDALAHADAALTWEGIGTESVGVRAAGAGGGQGMGGW